MTVVAIWFEPTEQLLWSVTDTRISAPGSNGGTTIRTDSGAKLFSIPIRCYQAVMDESFHKKSSILRQLVTHLRVTCFQRRDACDSQYVPPKPNDSGIE